MRAGCGEPGDRVHQHREEGHDDDDRGLGLPVEAEPHDHDRRDADDRQRRRRNCRAAAGRGCRNGDAVGQDRDEEAGAAADRTAGQHRLEEGLAGSRPPAIGSEAAMRAPDRRWAAAAALTGTPKPRTSDLPEEQDPGAEEQRDQRAPSSRVAGCGGADRRTAASTQRQASSQAATSSRARSRRRLRGRRRRPSSSRSRASSADRERAASADARTARQRARRSAAIARERDERRRRAAAMARPASRRARQHEQRRAPAATAGERALQPLIGRAPMRAVDQPLGEADERRPARPRGPRPANSAAQIWMVWP